MWFCILCLYLWLWSFHFTLDTLFYLIFGLVRYLLLLPIRRSTAIIPHSKHLSLKCNSKKRPCQDTLSCGMDLLFVPFLESWWSFPSNQQFQEKSQVAVNGTRNRKNRNHWSNCYGAAFWLWSCKLPLLLYGCFYEVNIIYHQQLSPVRILLILNSHL